MQNPVTQCCARQNNKHLNTTTNRQSEGSQTFPPKKVFWRRKAVIHTNSRTAVNAAADPKRTQSESVDKPQKTAVGKSTSGCRNSSHTQQRVISVQKTVFPPVFSAAASPAGDGGGKTVPTHSLGPSIVLCTCSPPHTFKPQTKHKTHTHTKHAMPG